MLSSDDRYVTPKWRTFWLVIGFTILVAIGVVTVLLPELEDEPDEDRNAEVDDDPGVVRDESKND